MRRKYDSMLPSGDSQMQGGNSETGGRHDSPRKQEKQHTILQVVNKLKMLFCGGHKRAKLYDQKEYERGVKAVMKGKFLVKSTHEAIEMLIDQQTLLGSIPLDAMRNNSNKLVNQDMDVVPLEEMNQTAEDILHQVARNIHDSNLMKRYVNDLAKAEREKWQLSEVDKAMVNGAEKACEIIREKAETHLIGLDLGFQCAGGVKVVHDGDARVGFLICLFDLLHALGHGSGGEHKDLHLFLRLRRIVGEGGLCRVIDDK